MGSDKPSGPSQGRREVAMRLIQMVRHLTDFPIHKYATHVIRKVPGSYNPATKKWRKEGEQWRFRLQIRRVIGRDVDLARLFERLEPRSWTGDAISDAFWTFFLRGAYGAEAIDRPVVVKAELVEKRRVVGASGKGADVFAPRDAFFEERKLDRATFVDALRRCVEDPENTFPAWIRAAGWDDVLDGERPAEEYDAPPAPPPKRAPSPRDAERKNERKKAQQRDEDGEDGEADEDDDDEDDDAKEEEPERSGGDESAAAGADGGVLSGRALALAAEARALVAAANAGERAAAAAALRGVLDLGGRTGEAGGGATGDDDAVLDAVARAVCEGGGGVCFSAAAANDPEADAFGGAGSSGDLSALLSDFDELFALDDTAEGLASSGDERDDFDVDPRVFEYDIRGTE
jgi:hypothetical protein